MNIIIDEAVKIWEDYPRLTYKESIDKAMEILMDKTKEGEDEKMINLDRFESQYVIQLVDVMNGETVRELDLTKKELEDGLLKSIFEEEEIFTISNDRADVKGGVREESFMGTDDSIICNIFVNGLIVKDIEKELGIKQTKEFMWVSLQKPTTIDIITLTIIREGLIC